jgi:flagellar motility protein MotE (MotC chaperone)
MNLPETKRSHVLLTLGILFTIGGSARFMPSPLARAEGPEPVPKEEVQVEALDTIDVDNVVEPGASGQTESAKKEPPTLPQVQIGEACFSGETAVQLSKDKALVDKEMAALRTKEVELKDWENKLKAETSDLQALQKSLDAKWAEMQQGSTEDIKHLAQMYGAMKPDQAAQIFNKMDPVFAAGFLRKLSSAQAGLILAGMDTEKAYIVSVRLASMNDDVRLAAIQ